MTGNLDGNKSGEIARQLIKFSLPLIFSGSFSNCTIGQTLLSLET